MTGYSPPVYFLAHLFVISAMLSIGLEVTGRQVVDALRDRGLIGRALLANLVLVPVLGLVLVRLFPMSPDVQIAVLLLAAAPGAPFAVQFTRGAKGAVPFAAALLFLLTLLALVVTAPLTELLLPGDAAVRLPVWHVLRLTTFSLLVPLLVGFALQRWAANLAGALRKPVAWCAGLSFPAVVLLTMGTKSAATRAIGTPALIAMLLLVVAGMLVGWFLGGPDTATRRVLATGTGMRNAMVAILVTGASFPGSGVDVAVLAFSALMVPPNLLFTIYQNRRARAAKPAAPLGAKR